MTRTTPPPHPWWSPHHRGLSRCRIRWDLPEASSSPWDPVGSASSVVVPVGSASRPLPVGYLPAVPGNSAALPGLAPITPMSTAASTSDNGSRHPRSDRAPSTRAGATKFVVRRPSVPLFHLPSSVAGAARPMGVHCIVTPHAVQIGHQAGLLFVVVATCHSDFLVILYFTRLGAAHGCIVCSSLDRSGGSHGPPLPTASPFPAAYCKHGE